MLTQYGMRKGYESDTMEHLKVVFSIVNYMNDNDTVECVDTIIANMDTDSYHIILVDNASPNESGIRLKEHFEGNNKVTVLINLENKGNSEGWNYGIRYAKENFEFDYIALPDNDTLFIEKDFSKKLDEEYRKSDFAVLGPMVMTPTGRCDVNPIFDIPYTRERALYDIKIAKKKIRQLKMGTYGICRKFRSIMQRILPDLYRKPESRRNRNEGSFLYRQENKVLHGCCFILSRTFFSKFEQLDVRSFMYAEEDIMYKHVTHEKMKIVYQPDIKIYHKGDRSTNKAAGNNKNADIFRAQQSIIAIQGYLSLLDELGE